MDLGAINVSPADIPSLSYDELREAVRKELFRHGMDFTTCLFARTSNQLTECGEIVTGVKQGELADEIGISASQVSMWLSGKLGPSVKHKVIYAFLCTAVA